MNNNSSPTIVIAGGAGFVGSHLIAKLRSQYHIRGLSRGKVDGKDSGENLEWQRCDLFSLSAVRKSLQGAHAAIYLVHSMLPANQLTQASFQDLDHLAADNFARAAKEMNVQHIIYVGGIIPDTERLSPHLTSRLEVEKVLGGYGTPVTSLRCAMIIGDRSSSLAIVEKLARRLPAMICPAWTLSRSAPVGIQDLCTVVQHYLAHPPETSQNFDIAGGTTLTYRNLIEKVASCVKRAPRILNVPLFTPQLSTLWVTLVTGAPWNLVSPLVDSLSEDMLPRPDHLPNIEGYEPQDIDTTLRDAFAAPGAGGPIHAFQVPKDEWREWTVCSVQRFQLPEGWKVADVATAYLDWLPRALPFILAVSSNGQQCSISLQGIPAPLLQMELLPHSSHETRAAFRIVSGLLVDESSEGTLEFRTSHDGRFVFAAIHQFRPALPWYIYRWTQAVAHGIVMGRFGAYLASQ